MDDRYNKRGVSSKKEDVHNALKNIDKGIFPSAFCKIIPDYLGGDQSFCNIMHSDGAGTKSSLAYLYYRETGDISVFKGIAMDSIVMNVDDLICVGCTDNLIISSTIGRNPSFISGDIIKTLIEANEEIANWYTKNGIKMTLTGGETADVGDLVRTLIVDTTITARMKKTDVIDNGRIKENLAIVGLSSSGKANFENEYNSGIGSNGLTSARHDVFNEIYKKNYPESFNPLMPYDVVYSGPYKLTDKVESLPLDMGRAVLSPTRTYAFVVKEILSSFKDKVYGIIHCSGGGQTKCLKFGENVHYVKNNLFEIPPLFKIIKDVSGTGYKEMYQVFNMGHRLEIFTEESVAQKIIDISKSYNIDAKIIGYTKKSEKNKLTLTSPDGEIEYMV
ncbi:MAG: phosphoribosylformylglycinamidine cyclo-ligase [Spirochaetes bacterium GWD1_27_9]|nr:MAG: phosphoribosylformylglycinamidine cyclo-ligase [Spirochaetes bacterium GWB1_27_13]OHD27983.1 MAG: phosphoribosylformylglycinamidine cyclo-ligase [Spirochaetes bacterium GWC1_27_15]OHD33651.1 MAG: phosphoribosylformylglycinamidine cyclo-ligase [Spirochaetes bacterium GWD1_27_9]